MPGMTAKLVLAHIIPVHYETVIMIHRLSPEPSEEPVDSESLLL